MEIERKYLIESLSFPLEHFEKYEIKQAYISFSPTVRLRIQDGDCFLTVKSKGALAREEFELSITREDFDSLSKKTEGHTIEKTRYIIPIEDGLIAELDVFKGIFAPLITVEVEFDSITRANSFIPPGWFGRDITFDVGYKNSNLAKYGCVLNDL